MNTIENINYISNTLPSVDDFGIKDMDVEERNRFVSWYNQERLKYDSDNGMLYDLRREMLKYCYDDCFVLATAFSKFNESMIMELKSTAVKGHDYTILADFITLPQMVIHWFVGCMMNEREISVVPSGGYFDGKCGSRKERIWLTYLDAICMYHFISTSRVKITIYIYMKIMLKYPNTNQFKMLLQMTIYFILRN